MALPSARDLMVPLDSYPLVRDDCSLHQALNTMSQAHIEMHGESSLPRILLVFDRQDTLLGLLRRRDILRGLSPQWFFSARSGHPEDVFNTAPDHNISEVLADKVISRFRERAQLPITDYVQPIDGVVESEASLINLVNVMVNKGYHMLPVIEHDHIIGVVRSVEVMWAMNTLQRSDTYADTAMESKESADE